MIDIEKIISSKKEDGHIEAKLAEGGLPRSMWESYSAFANTNGGVILLGLKEDKETKKLIPVGVDNPEKMMSEIWNTLNNSQRISSNILLDKHVYVKDYDDKKIIVIDVPRANRRERPVYIGQDMFKGTYRRNHEGDYRCTVEEIKAMLRDQASSSQDALVIEEVELSELNYESIKRYRTVFKNVKPKHVWGELDDEEFLIKIGAAAKCHVDGKVHPTLGGLLFFGDFVSIMSVMPNFFLDYREYLGGEKRWSDRVCSGDGDWSGNVFDFYYRVVDRMTSDVKRAFRLENGLTRIDDNEIHEALRESLANALIHADYYGRRGIVIDKTFRKVTISNPGTFRIEIEEAISGGISDARNGNIFNMFSLINVGERSGTGICNLFYVWNENGFRQPQIIETINPDRTRIILDFGTNEAKNEAKNEANEAKNEANEVKLTGDLEEKEHLVLSVIKDNNTISAPKIGIELGISKSSVDRAIKGLKEKGYVLREGPTNGGTWKILK